MRYTLRTCDFSVLSETYSAAAISWFGEVAAQVAQHGHLTFAERIHEGGRRSHAHRCHDPTRDRQQVVEVGVLVRIRRVRLQEVVHVRSELDDAAHQSLRPAFAERRAEVDDGPVDVPAELAQRAQHAPLDACPPVLRRRELGEERRRRAIVPVEQGDPDLQHLRRRPAFVEQRDQRRGPRRVEPEGLHRRLFGEHAAQRGIRPRLEHTGPFEQRLGLGLVAERPGGARPGEGDHRLRA